MKRFLAFLCAVSAFVACTDDTPETPPVPPTITIETPEPEDIPDEGGEAVVEFTAPEPWVVEVATTRTDDWVKVEPMSGDAGNAQITITTTPNDTYDDREATITIKAGSMEETISVKQEQKNALVAADNEFEIDFNGGVVDFEVETNVDLTITISDDAKEWIQEVTGTRGLETKALSFEIAAHKSTADRSGEITISGGGLEQKITINQVYPVPNDEIWYTSMDEEIVVPAYDNVFDVTIVSNEYKDGKGVIKFDGDVTTIGMNAFAAGGKNKNLKSILLPNSVTELGHYVFNPGYTADGPVYCNITEIIIPDNVVTLGRNPFYGCIQLTNFYGKYASDDHKSLIKDEVLVSYAIGDATEVTIPEGVKEIGARVFYNNPNLTKVNFSSSVITIGESAFAASGLTSLDIPANITTIKRAAFEACKGLTELTIPSNVITIGEYAFDACSNIASITLAEGVKEIKTLAFAQTGITEITIPNSVEKIEQGAFFLNLQLSEFKGKFASADGTALIDNNVFLAVAGAQYFEEYNIPDNITEVGARAFMDIRNFGTINIPASVTKISDFAFTGQFDTTINWTDNITEIGYQGFAYSFRNMTENLVLPASLTTIGDRAFMQIGAPSITIPAKVTSIGEYFISNTANLTTIYCLATTPPVIKEKTFRQANQLTTIAVPAASVDAYKNAEWWSALADKIVAIE